MALGTTTITTTNRRSLVGAGKRAARRVRVRATMVDWVWLVAVLVGGRAIVLARDVPTSAVAYVVYKSDADTKRPRNPEETRRIHVSENPT